MIFHFISKTTCTLLTGCCAPCKLELDALVLKKRQEYFINSKRRASICQSTSSDQYPVPGWKPKGVLVAHLHEHQVKYCDAALIFLSRILKNQEGVSKSTVISVYTIYF